MVYPLLRFSTDVVRRLRAGNFWLAALLWLWPAVFVSNSGPSMTDSTLLGAVRLVDAGSLTLGDEADPEIVFLTKAFDISVHDGKIYSGVGPGASVLAAPFYLLSKPLLSLFPEEVVTNRRVLSYYRRNSLALDIEPAPHFKDSYLLQILLVWCLVAPLFASFLRRFHRRLIEHGCERSQALVIVLGTGLGSMALYYSTMYSRQAVAYLFAWHAILSLWRAPSTSAPSSRTCAVAGLLCGAAVAIDYPSAILVGVSILFLLPRSSWRQLSWLLTPCLAAIASLAIYHQTAFGSPVATPYQNRFWASSEMAVEKGLSAFEQGRRPTANPPSPAVMLRLSFGFYKGLFVYSPILLLGMIGHLTGLWRGRRKALTIYSLAVFLAYLTFNSTLGTHVPEYGHHFWGGLSMLWGPRHLFAVVPFLALGLVSLDWKRPWIRRSSYALLLGSCAINLLGPMFSHVMLSTYAFGPELRFPIAYGARLLLEQGPRVPLLDVYGVRPRTQAAVVGSMVIGSVALIRLCLRERRDPRPEASQLC